MADQSLLGLQWRGGGGREDEEVVDEGPGPFGRAVLGGGATCGLFSNGLSLKLTAVSLKLPPI